MQKKSNKTSKSLIAQESYTLNFDTVPCIEYPEKSQYIMSNIMSYIRQYIWFYFSCFAINNFYSY